MVQGSPRRTLHDDYRLSSAASGPRSAVHSARLGAQGSGPPMSPSAFASAATQGVNGELASAVASEVGQRLLPQLTRMEQQLQMLSNGSAGSPSPVEPREWDWRNSISGQGGGFFPMARRVLSRQGSRFSAQGARDASYARVLQAVEVQSPSKEAGESFLELTSNEGDSMQTWSAYFERFLDMQEPERSGCLADLVESAMFERVTLVVIILNIVFIWTVTDWTASHETEQ